MTKRKRRADAGERVEGENQKRAKVEVPSSTPDVGIIDRPSKTSGNGDKAPSQSSRKRNNEGRALKYQGKEKEQSGPKVEVSVQNKDDTSDVRENAGGNEQKAPVQGSRKGKNGKRALKYQGKEKEQSGPEVGVPLQSKKAKSDLHEPAENVKNSPSPIIKHDLPLENQKKRPLDTQADAQLSQKSISSNMGKSGKEKPWMKFARRGKEYRKLHAGEVALIDGEQPEVHASQRVQAGRQNRPIPNSIAQEKARKAIAAGKDILQEVDDSDQNHAEGSLTSFKVDEVEEIQQMPLTGKKPKRSLAQEQDGETITISEAGEVAVGVDESEVLEPSEGHDVQQHLKKTKSQSSKKSKPKSNDMEGVGLDEGEVVDISEGHDVQQHSRRKTKSKSGKKSKVMSTDVEQVERSVASDSAFERAVAASHPEWNVARSTGGQMLDSDPVFSKDEEYILISYPTYVVVYSTANSLPVRTLRIKKGESVATTCLSPLDPKKVYIISRSGLIELWDWSDGKKVDSWKLNRDSTSFRLNKGGDANERMLAYIIHDKPVCQLCVYDLANTERVSQDATRLLFTHEVPITSLHVLDDGKQIVMTSGAQMILGTCQDPYPTDLQSLIYDWHIVTCPDWIASIDVRIRPVESDKKGQQKKQRPFQSIDLALGCLRGSIHLYDDLQHKLYEQQRPSLEAQAKEITSRQLHWHRNAVLAVKWSADGKYIISGGQETVLVVWQLDTGRKDMLPHLGAPIENLVVSPQGSSYAVRLADNSAMILSTAEMRPTFSVAGIQIPTMDYSSNVLPALPTVDNAHARPKLISKSPTPASVCPSRPGRLLIAVPSYCASRSSTVMSGNASYLQTIELSSCQQLSRQALVRTKVTDLNTGPEGNLIEEPNVKHIATSHDGQWLATADEWAPPTRDIESLAFDSEKAHEEEIFRQEVHLKFWSWNRAKETWELVARIDNPHSSSFGSTHESGGVIALISDPSEVGFVTFGEDGRLKSWRPVNRRRHGSEVKGKDGLGLTNWRCSFSTFIGNPNDAGTRSTQPAAKLAYSPDGSVIALSLQTETAAPIYLLDGFDGSITSVQTGLYSAPLLGLGIIDRHLIIVACDLVVWDLVNDEEHYRVNLELLDLPHSTLTTHSHLAINLHDKTFALATPAQGHRAKGKAGLKSDIAIFDPFQEKPLFIDTLPHATVSLQPEVGGRGYHAIDFFAEVRAITPLVSLPSPPAETAGLLSQTTHSKGLDQLFGRPSEDRPKLLADQSEAKDADDGNGDQGKRPEVKLEQLQALFHQAPSHDLPPVDELFNQVIDLYGRKHGTAVE